MLNLFKKTKFKIIDWSIKNIQGKKAEVWLAILSFSEASFFLVPPDVLLIAILSANAQRWLYYSSFTTIFSVLGGAFGFIIGSLFFKFFGEPIISFYNLQQQMLVVAEQFSNNAFLTIFLSAFTPIPYKLFTISAGFFKIDFLTFMIASFFGRGMRFFAVGYVMKKFGTHITAYIFKYFDIISILIIIVILFLLIF